MINSANTKQLRAESRPTLLPFQGRDFSYRTSFLVAVGLHFCIILSFLLQPQQQRPVLVATTQNIQGQMTASLAKENTAIKAVSLDESQVMASVQRLQQERLLAARAETQRMQKLQQQTELMQKRRLVEQKRLQVLKQEEARVAIARQKQLEQEKARLKQVALERASQEKQLAAIKQQQEQIQKQALAELNKQKANQASAEKAKLELAKKQESAAIQAAENAARQARLSGEVNKYKALIVNAIGRQWILPENANRQLSSKFRIRLAPNGAVLEVSLLQSSGDPLLDRSAQSAIYKASPFPVPADIATFNLFREISLTVRPESARG